VTVSVNRECARRVSCPLLDPDEINLGTHPEAHSRVPKIMNAQTWQVRSLAGRSERSRSERRHTHWLALRRREHETLAGPGWLYCSKWLLSASATV
jgi:hypothetical protein